MNKIEYDKLRAERMLKFFLNDRSPRKLKYKCSEIGDINEALDNNALKK